jgi:hypothetical protein
MMRAMNVPDDLIPSTQARALLEISPFKMSKLIKQGVIRTYPDPLDDRVKLVSKSAVLALVQKRAEAA